MGQAGPVPLHVIGAVVRPLDRDQEQTSHGHG
jgi:hypothetical protein